jgi:hypothetical protein
VAADSSLSKLARRAEFLSFAKLQRSIYMSRFDSHPAIKDRNVAIL